MPVPPELLARIAQTLRITRADPPLAQVGQFLRFAIGPDPGLLRAVDPDLVTRNIALALDATLQAQAVSSAAPIAGSISNLTGGLPGTITASVEAVTNQISGTIQGADAGSLSGSLPIPVEVPVTLTVKWGAYRRLRGTGPGGLPGGVVDALPGSIGGGRPGARPAGVGVAGAAGAAAAVSGGVARRDRSGRLAAAVAELDLETLETALPMAASAADPTRRELEIGEDFLAPDGVERPDVSLLFAPAFKELTIESLPSVQTIYVYATVTLTVPGQPLVPGENPYGPIELPAVKVLLPVLPVPKLLALFRYSDFNLGTDDGLPQRGQAMLLVVPARSPLGSLADLQPIVSTLRTVLAPLRGIRRFARFLLGVNLLGGALSRRPRLRFVIADRIDDLERIRLITVTRWEDSWVNDQIPDIPGAISFPSIGGSISTPVGGVGVPDVSLPDVPLPGAGWPGNNADNDIDANNMMSSLILFGPRGATAECFIDDNVDPAAGRLVVTTDIEGVVMIPSLLDPENTVPENRAVADPPANPPTNAFHNRISSLRL